MKRIFPIIMVVIMLTAITGCTLPVMKENTIADSTPQVQTPTETTTEETGTGTTADVDGVTNSQVDSALSSTVQGTSATGVKIVPVTLYYQDREGFLIPVTRKVEKQDGIARAALSGLIDNAYSREELRYYGLYPVLPAGTEILGIKIADGLAVVDFNAKLLESPDQKAEKRVLTSIVYTLTEFKTVDHVELHIDGKPLDKMKFNTDVSKPLGRDNITVNASFTPDTAKKKKIDVYLLRNSSEKFSFLLPVSFQVSVTDEKKLPAEVVRLLTVNYEEKGLGSEIPEGTKLNKSQVKGSLISLDFNEKLASYGGGTAREEAIIKQILFSMKQLDGITKIKFTIGGKSDPLPEGADISEDIMVPQEINSIIDS